VPINDRRFRGKVRAFGWVDPGDWIYMDRRPPGSSGLISVGIVLACPLCLCERVKSLFSSGSTPYYYPLTMRRGERGSYGPVIMAIRRSMKSVFERFLGPTISWYPRIEDAPPKSETIKSPHVLKCPTHRWRVYLRAITPIRTYPRFRDYVVKQSLVESVEGLEGSFRVHHLYARVARVMESVLLGIEGNYYRVDLAQPLGRGEYGVIGLCFPTTCISLELEAKRIPQKLGEKLSSESRRAYWWWAYHVLMDSVRALLQSAEERGVQELRFLDPAATTHLLVRALQGVYVARVLECRSDECIEVLHDYVRELASRSSRNRGYSPYLGVLIERAIDAVSRRVLGSGFGVKRFDKVFRAIEDSMKALVTECVRVVEGSLDVSTKFLAYVAMHTASHALARRLIEDLALDPFDIAVVCNDPSSERVEVGMYELFEGGAGVLSSFFEECRKDLASAIVESGRVAIECPRNRVRAVLDNLLHPETLPELRRVLHEGVHRLVELVEGITGTRLSAGMLSRVVRLVSDPRKLVGAAALSLIVRSLESLIGSDFDPRLAAMVLDSREMFVKLTEREHVDEWRSLLEAARGLKVSVESVEGLRGLARELAQSRRIEVSEAGHRVQGQRIVIALEEIAPIHVDGCWMCLNVPSCPHGSMRSYTLQPYLSAGLLRVLIESLS